MGLHSRDLMANFRPADSSDQAYRSLQWWLLAGHVGRTKANIITITRMAMLEASSHHDVTQKCYREAVNHRGRSVVRRQGQQRKVLADVLPGKVATCLGALAQPVRAGDS